MANFDDVTLFGNTSLSDIFKQIHRNNKDTDKQINELIDALKPLASSNAGSAVMLMPTVKDLIDVNVRNNDQLIKMVYKVTEVNGQKTIEGDVEFENLTPFDVYFDGSKGSSEHDWIVTRYRVC